MSRLRRSSMPLNGDFPAAICAAIVGFAKTPICVLCWGKTRLPLGSWSRGWRGASGQRNWILVMATIATCNCQLPVASWATKLVVLATFVFNAGLSPSWPGFSLGFGPLFGDYYSIVGARLAAYRSPASQSAVLMAFWFWICQPTVY